MGLAIVIVTAVDTVVVAAVAMTTTVGHRGMMSTAGLQGGPRTEVAASILLRGILPTVAGGRGGTGPGLLKLGTTCLE